MEIEISDTEFEEKVLKKSLEIPVVVDFWAPWCAPCNILSPVLEKFAKEYEDRFILIKANVENNQQKAAEYGVRGIPAVKMFKNGEVIAEFTGAISENEFREWVDNNL